MAVRASCSVPVRTCDERVACRSQVGGQRERNESTEMAIRRESGEAGALALDTPKSPSRRCSLSVMKTF